MSGRGRRLDKRIECNVVHLLWCPASKVPEAMCDDEGNHPPSLRMSFVRTRRIAGGGIAENGNLPLSHR